MNTNKPVLAASPEQLRAKFLSLSDPESVADLFEITSDDLIHHVFDVPPRRRYIRFNIPKRSGDLREISAPTKSLKQIQRRFNQVLHCVYKRKGPVHGFVSEQSIVSNADCHFDKRYILNVDLKDFFPSIHPGRVRGMFMAKPYNLSWEISELLASICCFNNELPQGAPTSPIISNMICAKMDSYLQRLAKKHHCYYTRYADDITFSTYLSHFPAALATLNVAGQAEVGAELQQIIEENGFRINPDKIRLQGYHRRQEVTGLTVNEFPNVQRRYINQIRAMLHDWRTNGPVKAQEKFLSKYDKKQRSDNRGVELFKEVVRGKIEFLGAVRGKNNLIYIRFREELRALEPDRVKEPPPAVDMVQEPFVALELGLEQLLSQLDPIASVRSKVINLVTQLRSYIELSRRYGEAPSWTTNIRKIVRELNKIARAQMGVSLTELSKLRAETISLSPSTDNDLKNAADTDLSNNAQLSPHRVVQSVGTRQPADTPAAEPKAKMARDKIFISYSHRDRKWLEMLQKMLYPLIRQEKISIWDDTQIQPGQQWRSQIEQALASASVAVLLVSPDFLASKFIREHELPPLLAAAESEGVIIFCIAVRSSYYEATDILRYQFAHDVKKPLAKLSVANREAELVEIVKRLQVIVNAGV